LGSIDLEANAVPAADTNRKPGSSSSRASCTHFPLFGPKLVERSHPPFPEAALRAGFSGTVRLEATVGVDGRVVDVRLLPGSAVPFAASSIDAVKRWRYALPVLEGAKPPS
jgi:protein TonB